MQKTIMPIRATKFFNFFYNAKFFWIFLVIAVSTIWPRLAYLGNVPQMDEGYYIWQAKYIYESIKLGLPLPDTVTLTFYPLLLSPLCGLPGPGFLWFRIADCLAAIIASFLFCKILQKYAPNWKTALIIGFVFLCAMNEARVIDAGFKNSITAAYIPLFCAILFSLSQNKRWFVTGICTGFGVLLREPFFIFAILGLCAIVYKWGWRPALSYCLGGLAIGLPVLIILGLWREDFFSIITSYALTTVHYKARANEIASNFFSKSWECILNSIWAIALFLYALINDLYIHFKKIRVCQNYKAILFWVCACVSALLEPAYKIGFIYHFAVCLPPIAFLCAISWPKLFPGLNRIILVCAITGCIIALPSFASFKQSMINTASLIDRRSYPHDQIQKSNLLLAAQEIKKFMTDNGLEPNKATFVSSAFTYNLYPVTNFWPPVKGYFVPEDGWHMSDLARTWGVLNKDREKFMDELEKNQPEAIAVAYVIEKHEPPHTADLIEMIKETGKYELLKIIPANKQKNFGWLGFYLFKKI